MEKRNRIVSGVAVNHNLEVTPRVGVKTSEPIQKRSSNPKLRLRTPLQQT